MMDIIFESHTTISPLDAEKGIRVDNNIKLGALPLFLCTYHESSLSSAPLQLNKQSQERQHICSI
jgi:hypothetical protein